MRDLSICYYPRPSISTFHNIPAKQKEKESELQLPPLARSDILRYRFGFFENLCFEALEQGFHETFTEIFNLVQEHEARRQKAGPDTEEWMEPQLRHQVVVLRTLANYLAGVEAAALAGEMSDVYKGYLNLANSLFNCHEVAQWLVEHFLSKCITVTQTMVKSVQEEFRKSNGDKQIAHKLDAARQLEAEAIFHMAGYLRNRDYLEDSISCYRQLYEKTLGSSWITPVDTIEEASTDSNSLGTKSPDNRKSSTSIADLFKKLGQKRPFVKPQSQSLHLKAAELLADALLCFVSVSQKTRDLKENLDLLHEVQQLIEEVGNRN